MDPLQILKDLVEKLPTCEDCKVSPPRVATYRRLDAAGDPVWTCDEHAHQGGISGDEGPLRLRYAEPLKQAILLLRKCGWTR
jgi:hypothetical protein